MFTSLFPSADIFFKVLCTKLSIALKQFMRRSIDLYIWAFCTLLVTGYIFQAFGMKADFGPFQLGGAVATAGLFEIFGNTANMIMDIEGDRNILYYLTLPTSAATILLSMVCSFAIMGTLLSLVMVPLGKLLFWNSMDLTLISPLKLVIILALSNLFFAILSLAVTAYTKQMARIGSVWSRFLFPLWFLGGFQYSWFILHKTIPTLAYISLFNPVTYVMEGTRAAMLGQAGYLSWWGCCAALCAFIVLIWTYAYVAMKKHLDFV